MSRSLLQSVDCRRVNEAGGWSPVPPVDHGPGTNVGPRVRRSLEQDLAVTRDLKP